MTVLSGRPLTREVFLQTLAAVALDEDIPQPEDNTRPAYETIEKVSRTLLLLISPDGC